MDELESVLFFLMDSGRASEVLGTSFFFKYVEGMNEPSLSIVFNTPVGKIKG